jgi:PKD repeat protein
MRNLYLSTNYCFVKLLSITAISLLTWLEGYTQGCEVCTGQCITEGPELIVNGDFSQVILNNYTPSAGYLATTYMTGTTLDFGEYLITDDPFPANNYLCCHDHTNGSTFFLCADGHDGDKTSAWGQVVDISSYPPNTDFIFCAYVNNLQCPQYDYEDPELKFLANGVSIIPGILTLPEVPNKWILVTTTWNSGNNPPSSVTLEIVTVSEEAIGNDFAIDDISAKACIHTVQLLTSPDVSICAGDSVQIMASGTAFYSWYPATGLSDSTLADPIAFPSATTTYYVTGTDSSGCFAVDSITITVYNVTGDSISIVNDTLFCPPGNSYQWFTAGNPIIGATDFFYVPLYNDYYSVLIGDSAGCFVYDTVYFANSPQTSFLASDTDICEKFCIEFIDLSTNGASSWEWNFPGGIPATSLNQDPGEICYTVPGIYDVMLITFNSFGSDTLILDDYITVYATPPFPIITQNGNVLTSSPAVTYQWQFNSINIPGATTQSFNVTQTGYYTIVITDANGCTNLTTLYVDLTGIAGLLHSGNFSVYPNPSNGIFVVEVSDDKIYGTVLFSVLNAFNQEVYYSEEEFTPGKWKKVIDLKNAVPGFYSIEIKSEKVFFSKKLLVQK